MSVIPGPPKPDPHSWLIEGFNLLDQWLDLIRAVEEAELRVQMESQTSQCAPSKEQSQLVFDPKVELLCGCLIGGISSCKIEVNITHRCWCTTDHPRRGSQRKPGW